jgi:hypothetical protein
MPSVDTVCFAEGPQFSSADETALRKVSSAEISSQDQQSAPTIAHSLHAGGYQIRGTRERPCGPAANFCGKACLSKRGLPSVDFRNTREAGFTNCSRSDFLVNQLLIFVTHVTIAATDLLVRQLLLGSRSIPWTSRPNAGKDFTSLTQNLRCEHWCADTMAPVPPRDMPLEEN